MQGNLNEILKELPPDMARMVARYGVKLAIDLLQTLYADLMGEAKPAVAKRGRPKAEAGPKAKTTASGKRISGWSDDPEERSIEMQRRIDVRAEKLRKARASAAAKKRWEKMSGAQKALRLRAMVRGREQKRKAVVHLEKAS
jgi:hypothetical protein